MSIYWCRFVIRLVFILTDTYISKNIDKGHIIPGDEFPEMLALTY
jgi:hypothetical protein